MMRGRRREKGGGKALLPFLLSFLSFLCSTYSGGFPRRCTTYQSGGKKRGAVKKLSCFYVFAGAATTYIRSKAGPNKHNKSIAAARRTQHFSQCSVIFFGGEKDRMFLLPALFSGKKGRLRKLRIRHFGKRGGGETARGRKRARERKRERLFLLLRFAFFWGGEGRGRRRRE